MKVHTCRTTWCRVSRRSVAEPGSGRDRTGCRHNFAVDLGARCAGRSGALGPCPIETDPRETIAAGAEQSSTFSGDKLLGWSPIRDRRAQGSESQSFKKTLSNAPWRCEQGDPRGAGGNAPALRGTRSLAERLPTTGTAFARQGRRYPRADAQAYWTTSPPRMGRQLRCPALPTARAQKSARRAFTRGNPRQWRHHNHASRDGPRRRGGP